MYLSDALDEFVMWGMAKYAPATVRNYKGLIERFIAHRGDIPLRKVSVTDILEYHVYLKKKNYHDASIAYMMISLRQMFRYLFLRRMINWDYQLIPVPQYVHKSIRAIGTPQAEQMIEGVRIDSFRGLRDKTILALLYATGMRVGELCNLNLEDVDPEARQASIISSKNRLRRLVFWDSRTEELLRSYIRERSLWARCDALFIATDRHTRGERLHTRSVQRMVKEKRTQDGVSPHSFRKEFGLRMLRGGMTLRHLQLLFGHKSLTTLQYYTQLEDEDLRNAYQKAVDGTTARP